MLTIKPVIKLSRKTPFRIPRTQTEHSRVIGIYVEDELASFIFLHMSDDYMMFAYTHTYPEFRKKGYSLTLRKTAIKLAIDTGYSRVISIPFEGANSISLLEKLGFIKLNNIYELQLN